MRRGDLAAGILLAALGAGVSVRAAGLTVGSAQDPQPGFFPFVGSLLLLGLAGVLMVRALRGAGAPNEAAGESLGPPAILVLGLIAYAALLEWGGYPLMTALMALLALRVLGTRWLPGVAASVLLSLGSYFLFVKLGVPLPPGLLAGR